MAISVARAIELIVDWTHEEILALEAHLGIHPNRKPAVVQEAPTVAAPVEPQASVVAAQPETVTSTGSSGASATEAKPDGATASTEEASNGQEILQA